MFSEIRKVKSETNVKEGFIITKIDDKEVRDEESFMTMIAGKSGGVMFEGIYPDKLGTYFFAIGL